MNHYFLPPEWAPQRAVMLTWPHHLAEWYPSLEIVEKVFVEIARHVSRFEQLIIAVLDDIYLTHVRKILTENHISLDPIHCYVVPSNDVWARDHGPITVKDQHDQSVILNFQFNAWGNKYDASEDQQVTQRLHALHAFGSQTRLEKVPFVLEGGSIETDGQGSLLTTRRCLMSETRNPSFTVEDYQKQFEYLLGIQQILWLDHGYLAGDDTDSHIDTLARFVDAKTICYVQCNDLHDEHYAELQQMAETLRTFKTLTQEPYQLVALPMPKSVFNLEGRRLPATYANFLMINQAVLVPVYDDPSDAEALQILQKCFPDREIIGIYCTPLIYQFGSLHCVTMQIPF